MQVDDPIRKGWQPVRWRSRIRGHPGQSPERDKKRPCGTLGFLAEDQIALPAESLPPGRIADTLRIEEALQDLVFIDHRKTEQRSKFQRERRLAASRQSRDYDESSVRTYAHGAEPGFHSRASRRGHLSQIRRNALPDEAWTPAALPSVTGLHDVRPIVLAIVPDV